MPNLPTSKNCCGCGACVDSCPKGAIDLVEDDSCYYNICVDKDKCIECKLCEKHCHILQQDKLRKSDPTKVDPLAAWSTEEEIIKKSATGGIFAQIAKNMLLEGDTYVYGAALQDDNSVRHIEISNINDLPQLQNSKYQQSYSVGVYSLVKQRLNSGYRVLFSGVPCQIAALYTFLDYKSDIIEKLYTIEIICHGVPCNDLHRVALKYHKVSKIVAYRNKEGRGWKANNRLSYLDKNGKKIILNSFQKDVLFRSYLRSNFLRLNCYNCPYSDIHRVSDLTIGDFWGCDQTSNPQKYDNYWGTSICLPNSDKGIQMISGANLKCQSAVWGELLPLNSHLYTPISIYDYKGYRYMRYIKDLPNSIKKIIYQSGFSNRLIDRIFTKVLNIILDIRQKKNVRKKKIKLVEILTQLELK